MLKWLKNWISEPKVTYLTIEDIDSASTEDLFALLYGSHETIGLISSASGQMVIIEILRRLHNKIEDMEKK